MGKKSHPKIGNNIGLMLINLGTPEKASYFSVRKYLQEFLSDTRVIEISPILWKIILNIFILNFRTHKTLANYKKIWLRDFNESPLRHYTKSLAYKVESKLKNYNKNQKIIVDYAMRYGTPSISEKIHLLMDQGCRKIIFLPLYPQYSATTTATVIDEIYRVLRKVRWLPKVEIIDQYSDNKIYITSLANSIEESIKKVNWKPDAILASYHGIPEEYFNKGDPYYCYCNKTHRLLSEELIKRKISISNHISFQSRFGPKKWLQPYTSDVIMQLIQKGVKNLKVIAPGFACDCIETLEEINMEYKKLFLSKGGKNFQLIPCLNDSVDSVRLIESLFCRLK